MQRIEELYHRYQSNTISDDEKQELFALMREADDERLATLADSYLHEQEPEDLTYLQPDTDRILIGIKDHISRQEVQSAKKLPLQRIITIAATTLMIGFAAYYIYKNYNPTTEQQTLTSIYGDDVAPGGNRAAITLSDGTIVELSADQKAIIASGSGLSYDDGKKLLDAGKNIEYATLSTPRGGQYQLTLPDGTKVWLNAASSITYPTTFEDGQRTVKLQGEAYFDVATDKNKPFVVQSKEQQITVTGTQFNSSNYMDEQAATTLIEGNVTVLDQTSGKTAALIPGQQATFHGEDIKVKSVDPATYIAWKDGYFIFDSMDLSQILKQLSRWYDVDVDYTGVPNVTLSARVKRDKNISSVLNAISKTTGINFYVKERRIMLKK